MFIIIEIVYRNNISYIYGERNNSARYFSILYNLDLYKIRFLVANIREKLII